jgi:hypothetical protein
LTENGSITVDSVKPAPENISEYVRFNDEKKFGVEKPVVCFEYNSNGFIERDGMGIPKATSTATVTAHFILNPKKLQQHFGTTNELIIETVLTYENTKNNATLFGTNCVYTPNALLNGIALDYLYTSHDTNEYKFSVQLTGILDPSKYNDEVPIALNFTFTVADETTLKTFCAAIDNDNFKFNVSATLATYVETEQGGSL